MHSPCWAFKLRRELSSLLRPLIDLDHALFSERVSPTLSGTVGTLLLAVDRYKLSVWAFGFAGLWGVVCLFVHKLSDFPKRSERLLIRATGTVIVAAVVSFLAKELLRKQGELDAQRNAPRTPVSIQLDTNQLVNGIVSNLKDRLPAQQPIGVDPLPKILPADAGKAFSLEIENSAFLSDSRNWYINFWTLQEPNITLRNATTLFPANLSLFIRIHNKLRDAVYLDSYSVEILKGKEWIKLPRISTVDSKVFSAYPRRGDRNALECLHVAMPIDFSKSGLDDQLVYKKGRLDAREQIRGWALFEYPPELPTVTGYEMMRVSVYDSDGDFSTHTHDRHKEEPQVAGTMRDTILPEVLQNGNGPVDISMYPIKRKGDPSQ
jgi:hypothetical protein